MKKKNNPNMYQVTYQVMEGDNYAGGWVTKTAIVETLGDCERFKNVLSVKDCYYILEIGDEIPHESVNAAMADRKRLRAIEDKKKEREYLQNKLDNL